jgi:DUF438 domain-containing protein
MSELLDNQARRVQTLKEIIKELHRGAPPDQVRAKLKMLVREADYSEIAAMEQQLMAEGMPVEEVQSMCDLHSQVTREILVPLPPRTVPPGHPVDTLRRENEAVRAVILRMRQTIGALNALSDDAVPTQELLAMRQGFNDLMDLDKHYQRKEHVLFSSLERHGITGPSKVMWAKDDEIRTLLKELGTALDQQDASAAEWKLVAETLVDSALRAVEEMIYKEEHILLPLALNTLTEAEWGEVFFASPRYGWCLIEPRQGYRLPESVRQEGLQLGAEQSIQLPTGNLTFEQLLGLFETLPVDLTYVDADDRVAFFSEGADRIFARSKAVIGRKVQHCHPPRSVGVVERILNDFRQGTQSVAEFWIHFHGRFVHIRYFAVRDRSNQYLGTLEVTQDATRIRSLEGERRLLEYES